jgi:hypothetical protein
LKERNKEFKIEIASLKIQLEKEREESAAMHSALELLNCQLKQEHHEKLSEYEQQMLKLEAERKQIEDDLAAHKDEISSHKEAIDKHLANKKIKVQAMLLRLKAKPVCNLGCV